MRTRRIRAGGGLILAAVVVVLAVLKWLQSGSTLVVFVGGAVLAAVLLDVVVARALVSRARLTVSASTSDATVGDTITLRLSVAGAARPVTVRGAGVDRGLKPVQVDPTHTAKMPCIVGPRGVFTRLEVDVSSTGISGIAGWERGEAIVFAEPIFVGPRPVDPDQPLPQLVFGAPEGSPRPSVSGDIVRGVRPYRRGDALRRVHWPATARSGDLMVMEVEEPVAPRLIVVLSLTGPGYAAEQAAGRAAWYAIEALQRDYEVWLATMEVAGPVARRVSARHDVNRYLAAAVPGPLRLVTDDRPAVVEVSNDGDRWVS